MFTFRKKERLCSETWIDTLFHSGKRAMFYPFSIHWLVCPKEALPEGVRCQVLIATSKKKFHHAVDRNRVKRLTRECYRLHKPLLYTHLEKNNLSLLLGINYVHNEIFDYHLLETKMEKAIAKVIKETS